MAFSRLMKNMGVATAAMNIAVTKPAPNRPAHHGIVSLGCYMEQRAGIGVFQHPQRAIGAFFYITDAVARIPALGGFGAAMPVKDDAVKCHGLHATDEAIP